MWRPANDRWKCWALDILARLKAWPRRVVPPASLLDVALRHRGNGPGGLWVGLSVAHRLMFSHVAIDRYFITGLQLRSVGWYHYGHAIEQNPGGYRHSFQFAEKQ